MEHISNITLIIFVLCAFISMASFSGSSIRGGYIAKRARVLVRGPQPELSSGSDAVLTEARQ